MEISRLRMIIGSRYKKRLTLVFLGMLLSAALEVVSIGLILPFLKLVTEEKFYLENKYIVLIAQKFDLSHNATIICAGLIIIFMYALKAVAQYLLNKFQAQIIHTVRVNFSREFFMSYINMPYTEFVKRNIAEMIHNSTGQVNLFAVVFLQSLLLFVSEIVVIILIVFFFLLVNPVLMIITSLFLGFVVFTLGKKTKKIFNEVGERQNISIVSMYKVINESISALKEIRVLGVKDFFIKRFDEYSEEYKEMSIKATAIQIVPKIFLEFVFVSAVIVTIIYCIIFQQNLKEIFPILTLFMIGFYKIFPSLSRVVTYINQIAISKVSFDILYNEFEKLGHSTKVISDKKDVTPICFDKLINLSDINFSYVDGEKILNNFSLNIKKNTTVAFVGRSGAGKSTILDLLLGLLVPNSGDIKIDGISIFDNLEGWYKKVSYIPQSISFVDDTIKNNIALGINLIDEERLQEAIEGAQLFDFVKSLPAGINTQIGDKGVKLSGGQKQRIGIARALYKNPEILIFDEATSALDVETEAMLTSAINNLSHKKTIIIVAHRLSTIKDSDVIYILEQGNIVAHGGYKDLLVSSKWFRKINNT